MLSLILQNIRSFCLQAFEDTIQVNVSRKSSGDPLECSSANYEDSRKASKPVDELKKKNFDNRLSSTWI